MKNKIAGRYAAFLLGFVLIQSAFSQDPVRFQKEIDQFKADQTKYSAIDGLVLFTGSSTVRMWTDLASDFPRFRVLNRGFGGSHMSDLLYYADTIILQCRPSAILIYEGDNDLASGKNPQDIYDEAILLIEKIRKKLPQSIIFFFSAKPSLSRWNKKDYYLEYNALLRKLPMHYSNMYYIDTWNKMLDPWGRPDPSLFLEDSLHMNRKGYEIWKEVTGVSLKTHLVRGTL